MKITVKHILGLLDSLEKGVVYDYVSRTSSKVILDSVDFSAQEVIARKVTSDNPEGKRTKFTTRLFEILEKGVVENKPFSIDVIFNNSGSNRSALEALLVRTTEFYSCMVGRNKHLVWIPSNPHTIGEAVSLEENQIAPPVYERPAHTLQRIYFGTPGSGKSFTVRGVIEQFNGISVRITFHPDTDYASFVGSYKPVCKAAPSDEDALLSADDLAEMYFAFKSTESPRAFHKFVAKYWKSIKELSTEQRLKIFTPAGESPATVSAETDKALAVGEYLSRKCAASKVEGSSITYELVPQAFTNAYVKAWQNPDDPVFLVIEEINRGNCAQIFGDLFQLLDRDMYGKSEYPIVADADLKNYLLKEDVLGRDNDGIANGEISLPANLHILATMNTSDQSLFPMDSAFKRRWEWKYVPIDYKNEESEKFTINVAGRVYSWHEFLQKVNSEIYRVTQSEDKQMGNFFIRHSVGEDEFKDKVMFYLWSEVCKEEAGTDNNFFRIKDDAAEFSFNQLYTSKGQEMLLGFFENLGLSWKTEGETSTPQE